VNCIPDNSRLSPAENMKSEHVQIAIVQFIPARHTRHRQDRLAVSGVAAWPCELSRPDRPTTAFSVGLCSTAAEAILPSKFKSELSSLVLMNFHSMNCASKILNPVGASVCIRSCVAQCKQSVSRDSDVIHKTGSTRRIVAGTDRIRVCACYTGCSLGA